MFYRFSTHTSQTVSLFLFSYILLHLMIDHAAISLLVFVPVELSPHNIHETG